HSGEVLAAVENETPSVTSEGLAQRGAFPAASIFKLVTTAALLSRGISPDEPVCYHGGKHRLHDRELTDDERRDRRCTSLTEALAHSVNVAIAKLAERNLDPIWLQDWANRLLFNRPLPLDWAMPPSEAHVPDGPFDFANTAAGFGDVTLSPL